MRPVGHSIFSFFPVDSIMGFHIWNSVVLAKPLGKCIKFIFIVHMKYIFNPKYPKLESNK